MIVTFIGHSKINDYTNIKIWLYDILIPLIESGVSNFYMGSYGQFDNLVAITLTELKKDYPDIERIFVTPYINKKFNLELYNYSYYPLINKN